MLKSIYTPLSGAIAQERVLEIIANNLANTHTNGFKEESIGFKLLEPEPEKAYPNPLPPANYKIPFEEILPLRGNEISYVGVSGISRNNTQGSSIQTKNPLDVMLDSAGYFALHSDNGVMFTRDGNFSRNDNGALVDAEGIPVLGERGSIFLNSGKIEINRLGEIYQDGEYLDRILVYNFKDLNALEKIGRNRYLYKGSPEDQTVVSHPELKQGYLEASNVNAIKNLTAMILAHRSYQAYQQSIKNYDSMMGKANNDIAELRG